jgi:hypothetical protein
MTKLQQVSVIPLHAMYTYRGLWSECSSRCVKWHTAYISFLVSPSYSIHTWTSSHYLENSRLKSTAYRNVLGTFGCLQSVLPSWHSIVCHEDGGNRLITDYSPYPRFCLSVMRRIDVMSAVTKLLRMSNELRAQLTLLAPQFWSSHFISCPSSPCTVLIQCGSRFTRFSYTRRILGTERPRITRFHVEKRHNRFTAANVSNLI